MRSKKAIYIWLGSQDVEELLSHWNGEEPTYSCRCNIMEFPLTIFRGVYIKRGMVRDFSSGIGSISLSIWYRMIFLVFGKSCISWMICPIWRKPAYVDLTYLKNACCRQTSMGLKSPRSHAVVGLIGRLLRSVGYISHCAIRAFGDHRKRSGLSKYSDPAKANDTPCAFWLQPTGWLQLRRWLQPTRWLQPRRMTACSRFQQPAVNCPEGSMSKTKGPDKASPILDRQHAGWYTANSAGG